MQSKFQCHYRMLINWIDNNGQPKQEVLKDPITIEFEVIKTTQSENTSRITIYNLDGSTREAIYQDRLLLDTNPYVKWVTLEAGYGDDYEKGLPLVTWGYIQECHSYRSGTDFITVMDITDPDILTEYCGVTFAAGTTFKEAYNYLVSKLPNLKLGETGVLEGAFNIPTVFDGNVFVLVNKLTGGHTFVDNGVVHNLNDNETLSDYGCYYIAADTGLLETPKRYDHILEASMLFEPTIKIGQLVEIKSSTQARFDGQYKVLSVNHSCLISGAIEGTRTTTLQLQYIEEIANSNENLTANPAGSPTSTVKNNEVMPINNKISANARDVYDYIKKNNGQLPPGRKITHKISWKEMIYPGGTDNKPQDVKKHITVAQLQNCINIAEKLTAFVDSHFKQYAIKINSGYRTPENRFNRKKEGRLLASNHLTGSAIDFKLQYDKQDMNLVQTKKGFKTWVYGIGLHYDWGLHVSLNPKERF